MALALSKLAPSISSRQGWYMHTYLKNSLVISVLLLTLGCVHSFADPMLKDLPTEKCMEVKNGTLNVDSINVDSPSTIAYLFDCTVSVSISGPSSISGESLSKEERAAVKKKRVKIANFLLTKELSIDFKNEHSDTLIMSVIPSFLPDRWKEETVAALIKKGVNIHVKNLDGDTALDFAHLSGNRNIINMLKKSP